MNIFMQAKEKYTEILSDPLSRATIDLLIAAAGDDPVIFGHLAELAIQGKGSIPMRASWALEGIDNNFPELAGPYIKPLIKSVDKIKHTGALRNILKLLSRKKIPQVMQGRLINHCFEWLNDRNIPVAVKVYAMQIVANLSEEYPELLVELKGVLETLYDSSSPGFKSMAKKILKKAI
jgi:hypothetical protein